MKLVFIKTPWLVGIFIVLVAANVFIYHDVFAPRILTLTVFESGKGGATLIQTPSGKTMLVDTGPDASILRALGGVLPPWQRTIDAVVLTGASSKATGGLAAITSRYHVATTEKSPYSKHLSIDGVSLQVLSTASPSVFKIWYGSSSLTVASGTPPSVYISDGKTFEVE